MADAFGAGTGSSVTHTFDAAMADTDADDDVDDSVDAAEVMGTYNGASGTYKCTGMTDCMVTVDDEGNLTAASHGWIFTPDEGAESSQPDYEYLSYGFWLQKATDADDATTYNEVETFAMAVGFGDDLPTSQNLGLVQGSATYEGGSVGVYVKNVLDNQANIVTATAGHFRADVELNATFGGDNVAANNKFAIGGTITGFDLSGGEANDWAVELGLADFSTRADDGAPGMSGPGITHTPAFSGVATGDSTAVAGSWNGVFHGEAGDIGDPAVNTPPAAVVGEFNANFTDGTAAGGYGANIVN